MSHFYAQNDLHDTLQALCAHAARLIVEEGLDYGAAKRRAAQDLSLGARAALPDNDAVEQAVREHIAIFCAESQAVELRALRELALTWMQRLAGFSPHLAGSVWHGTATRLSDIYLSLFCEDSKATEIELINQNIRHETRETRGFTGKQVPTLSIHTLCKPLQEHIGLHLLIYDLDDLRGALHPDSQGRKPRGDARAVQKLLENAPQVNSIRY